MAKDTSMHLDINCETGEEILREFTAEEISHREASVKAFNEAKAQREAEEQAKIEAKNSALAKLTALGLTEEEVKALG